MWHKAVEAALAYLKEMAVLQEESISPPAISGGDTFLVIENALCPHELKSVTLISRTTQINVIFY